MKEEYYEIRGWDVNTDLQKRAQMEELDLGDIANGLEAEGLLRRADALFSKACAGRQHMH